MTESTDDLTAGLPPLQTVESRAVDETWDLSGVKTSEQLLTYLRDENAQELARSRVIDDRSKTNVTLAAVALPAVALLKPSSVTWWYGTSVCLTFLAVVIVLYFSARIVQNREADYMSVSWFRRMLDPVYKEQILYADLLSQIQDQLADQLENQRGVNTDRFDLLDKQTYALILVAVFAAFAVLSALIH